MKKIIFSLLLLCTLSIPVCFGAGVHLDKGILPDDAKDNFIGEERGKPLDTIKNYVVGITNTLTVFVGGLAILMLGQGASSLVISRGNDEGMTKAKGTVKMALIGLVVVILSWTLINMSVDMVFIMFSGGGANTEASVNNAPSSTPSNTTSPSQNNSLREDYTRFT